MARILAPKAIRPINSPRSEKDESSLRQHVFADRRRPDGLTDSHGDGGVEAESLVADGIEKG